MPLKTLGGESAWTDRTIVDAEPRDEIELHVAQIGRYAVLSKLGAGGMGVVYAAYDNKLDRKVALKLVHTSGDESARASLRMRREAQAMAKLSHPNVVPVFDVGEFQGRLFIAMEFVNGQTLDEWLTVGAASGASDDRTRTGSTSTSDAPASTQSERQRAHTLMQPRPRPRGSAPTAATPDDSTTSSQSGASALRRTLTGRRAAPPSRRPSHRVRGWREVLKLHCQAGAGLAAAHRAGLVHRDYKPSNVLVSRDGRARVLDFGLVRQEAAPNPLDTTQPDAHVSADDAAAVAPEATAAATPKATAEATPKATIEPSQLPEQDSLSEDLTIDGAIVGTPAYMSPEQFTASPIDARSDQFSFCVTLFEALYGQNPFHSPSMASRLLRIMNNAVHEPELPSDVPDWLHDALLRGLRYEPDERWPSMDELLEALTGNPEAAPDTDTAIRISRRSLIGGSLAFAVTAVVVWLVQKQVDLEHATSTPIGALIVSVVVGGVYVAVIAAGRRSLMRTRVSRQLVGCGAITCAGVIGTRLIPVFHEVRFEYGFLYGQLVIACIMAVAAVAVLRPLMWIAAVWALLIPITIWQLEYAPALQSVGVLITCVLGVRYWRNR